MQPAAIGAGVGSGSSLRKSIKLSAIIGKDGRIEGKVRLRYGRSGGLVSLG